MQRVPERRYSSIRFLILLNIYLDTRILVFGGHFKRHLGFHTFRMFRTIATLMFFKAHATFAFNKKIHKLANMPICVDQSAPDSTLDETWNPGDMGEDPQRFSGHIVIKT